jgi:hypothetical protein
MFGLIKIAIEAAVAFAIFVGGVKFSTNYPTLAAKLDSFLSWAKSKV